MQCDLTNEIEKELTLQIINDNLKVTSHLELLHWLQGDLQQFLPHNILISAWGDFSLGLIYLDIVALHPLLRTTNVSKDLLMPKIIEIFNLWQTHDNKPLQLNIEDNYLNISESFNHNAIIENEFDIKAMGTMNAAIVHGIKDNRGSYDCLYLMLSESSIPSSAKLKLAVFMPFIDCAFRRIKQLTEDEVDLKVNKEVDDHVINSCLSSRECSIMDLVQEGKSNEEISIELNISKFTVKNHLQKIYRKLGTNNRSQATFKYQSKQTK
jgi:transcriptional regulator EpsA